MKRKLVVEWAPFTVKEGIEEGAVVRASQALQSDFLSKQPGFVRRELLRGKGRQWVDIVYWESRRATEAAMEAAAKSEVCFRYFQLMADADHEEPGAGVTHFEQVEVFGG